MSTKVLVTGGNGQLAKTIQKFYGQNKDNIDFIFLSKEKLDIINYLKVKNYFEEHSFDYCINCAAYTNVDQAEKTPEIAYKVNAEAVKNLAKICKDTNTTIIHISTDYVFDGTKTTPYTENDSPNPINEYGKSKLFGEQHIKEILEKYFIVRTSWLYSKEFGNNFYKTILNKANNTKTELYITEEQMGCPTDTVNLSNYIYKLIKGKSSEYGIKHYCDDKVMTWFDFAIQILKENGLEEKSDLVKAKKYFTFARRPKQSILLNSK